MDFLTKEQQKYLKSSRVMAIISGILLVILGILFFVYPTASVFFAGVFLIIGLLIYGVYLIISFIAAPAGFKDGWELASGIILVICAGVILASSAANIFLSIAIILGITALMVGINQVISYTAIQGISGAGLVLAAGILNIILAFFLFFAPMTTTVVVGIVEGVYLCVTGISLIVEGFAMNSLLKDIKEETH